MNCELRIMNYECYFREGQIWKVPLVKGRFRGIFQSVTTTAKVLLAMLNEVERKQKAASSRRTPKEEL